MKNIKYSVKISNCPHCKESLDYSSEGKDLKKVMYSIFKLIEVHRSECLEIKDRKLTSVSIKDSKESKDIRISEYKTNKILF